MAVLIDGRNGEQSADNRADNSDFTVCNYPLCVSHIIDTWQIVYLSNKDPGPTILCAPNNASSTKVNAVAVQWI